MLNAFTFGIIPARFLISLRNHDWSSCQTHEIEQLRLRTIENEKSDSLFRFINIGAGI